MLFNQVVTMGACQLNAMSVPTTSILPEEITLQILSAVDLLDLLRCRAVRAGLSLASDC